MHVRIGRRWPLALAMLFVFAFVTADALSGPAALAGRAERRAVNGPPSYAAWQEAALRSALARYRRLAADPSFPVVPPFTSTLRPGARSDTAPTLRHELVALNDLPSPPIATVQSTIYDDALADAVKRFQRRHGLESDGAVGRATVAALRLPLAHRVRQLELALQRLPVLPSVAGEDALFVNIPMFRVSAFAAASEGLPVFEMNAIVGRARRTPTPVFDAAMSEVVFRPPWNVPNSIVRGELLSKIVGDPDYLRLEELEIVGVGDDVVRRDELTPNIVAMLRRGTLRLRQRPGSKNALGLVKFVFPNEHDVYMHGTPAPSLFARARRDFSHGCMRVADPVALAEWVLRDQPEWTKERIVEATLGSDTVRVAVTHQVHVVVFYMTAEVAPDGATVRFADDIYGDDARLERALRK